MKKGKKANNPPPEEENLERFAGSSDEEDEEECIEPLASKDQHHDADAENDTDGEDESEDEEFLSRDKLLPHNSKINLGKTRSQYEDDDDDDSSIDEEMDVATKMANAMGRILGTKSSNSLKQSASTSSVVLAKTITPLQKLQRKEKEQQTAIKEKRQANRERNLTALHLPLSIATTNTIDSGGLTMSKELEQERIHRRVATRGVVALFNAITQHQRSNNTDNESNNVSSKRKGETLKLTKHGFLDKIKAASLTKGNDTKDEADTSRRGTNVGDRKEKTSSSWGALKDDYMMDSKKNWDEVSSDEEPSDEETENDGVKDKVKGTSRKKQRFSGNR